MEKIKQIDEFDSWEDKTELLANKFADFFATYTKNISIEESERKYDDLTEFHISGTGMTFDMRKGDILPNKVEAFYKDKEIKTIKATYTTDKLTEVFISGKALEDFLLQV